MGWIGEEGLRRAEFHEPTGVHHGEAIGEACHHAQVVGDQQHGHAELGAQASQELEDLRLDRDVKRRGGFVGDQQARLTTEGHGDHRALAHAATELVGIVIDARRRPGDADEFEQLDGAFLRVLGAHVSMCLDRLGDLPPDGQDRIQAAERILEDHRDPGAADRAQLFIRQVQEILTLEDRGAGGDLADALGQQAQERQGTDALARSRLADKADGLAGADVIGQASNGPHHAAVSREFHLEVGHRQDGRPRPRSVANDRRDLCW